MLRGCPAAHCVTPIPPVKGAFGVPSGWPAATFDCLVPGVMVGSDGFTPRGVHDESGLALAGVSSGCRVC